MRNNPVPTLTGPHGLAWEYDVPALRAAGKLGSAAVAGWVVRAPWAHPLFHSYLVSVISLRLCSGSPPPAINLPGATHELFVHALDPAWELDMDTPGGTLEPCNFAAQFKEPSDEAARERVLRAATDILSGRLSPDTGYAQHWIRRFGSSNVVGDPARAGETVVEVLIPGTGASSKVVYDPVHPDATPFPQQETDGGMP